MADYTTFKIGGPAKYFCAVENEGDLISAVKFAQDRELPILIVGGGSNLIFPDSGYRGLVVHMKMMGVRFDDSGVADEVLAIAAAGENFDSLVENCVSRELYGLEGLSFIPGTVGASPVQNVGAYGTDVSDTISKVRVLDVTNMKFVELSNEDCRFTYRDSVFKHEKGRYIVLEVTYKLIKNGRVRIDYKDLKEYFAKRRISNPTLKEVRLAVIEIRKDKLPDWTHYKTAGSFFKNPIVTAEQFKELKNKYPELPGYPESDGRMKVSLGWILDRVCGAKGLTVGNVGTYEKQALVLVAWSGATATEVFNFSRQLMRCVKDKTGIEIEGEVEWAVS